MNQGLFVRAYEIDQCWICGSKDNPTREHKFKASDIRRQYGDETMFIGRDEDNGFSSRRAQGPNSKHLKFVSAICHHCNSTRTQASDRAYEQFIRTIETERDPEKASQRAYSCLERIAGSNEYINLFRYFGKLLGCHMADIGAPIPTHLSKFAAKKTNANRIWLAAQPDYGYADMVSRIGKDGPYSAHGGLVVITKKPKLLPTRLHSTSTVGAVQFVFHLNLTPFEVAEMRLRYPRFIQWCAENASSAIETPIQEDKLKQLGLRNSDRHAD
jgi:hypothetical protein